MNKKIFPSDNYVDMRFRAEERLRERRHNSLDYPVTLEEMSRLVHELSIHQIELEMQQEELLESRYELEKSLKRYVDLYDFAPVGYLMLTRDSTIMDANLAAATILGIERSCLKGTRFICFLDHEERPVFTDLMERVFIQREHATCEVELLDPALNHNAELLTPRRALHIDLVVHDHGQECRVILSDISQQKQIQQENVALQRERQERDNSIHTLFDAFPEPVFMIDTQGTILAANNAFMAPFEKKVKKIIGANVYTLIPPEVAIQRKKKVDEVLRTGQRLSFEDEWGGRNYQHTISPVIGVNNEITRMLIFAVDVISLNSTEKDILVQKTRYRGMFNNMSTGYAYCQVLFKDGIAVDFIHEVVNLNFKKIIGSEDVEGRKASRIFPDFLDSYPEIINKLGRVALGNNAERFEFHLKELNKWFDISLYSPRKGYVVALLTPMRNIDAGIWEWNLGDGKMVWSDELRMIYGLDRYVEEPDYEKWLQSIVMTDREHTEKLIRSAVAKGSGFNIVCHVLSIDGIVRRVMHQGIPDRGSDGVVSRYRGVTVDISEYVDKELTNPVNAENLDALLNVSTDPLCVISPDGTIFNANTFFKESYSRQAEEIIGANFYDLFSAELSRYRQAKFELVFYTGQPVHFKDECVKRNCDDKHKKKSLYQLSTYPVYGGNGQIASLAVFITDINETSKAEEARILLDKKYQTLIKTSPDSIITTNLQGVMTSVSDIALETYGTHDSSDLVGTLFSNIVHFHDNLDVDEIFNTTLHKGILQNREILLKKKNNTIYSAEISVALIQDNNGAPSSYMIIIRDISQRKIIESELFHAKRMASLGEMASGIAHEIFQPITNIGLLVDKIVMDATEGKCLHEKSINLRAEKIFENITRTQTIIDNVRSFSSSDKGYVSSIVNINKSIRNALLMVSMQCKSKSIKLKFQPNPDNASVTGNMYKFEEVILNLINNSVDALEEKRKKSTAAFDMQINIQSFNENDSVIISVDDNGIGISQENIEHIMHPFYTTKELSNGTGLGLSIGYRTIKEMNGTVSITSSPMNGACFTISFPRKP
jgi:PAS domain S-box-containing protein